MLDDLVDSTEAIIFVKDVQGRYTFVNRGYELAHRVSRETYLGKTDHDVFPKDIADGYVQTDRRVIETRSPSVSEESFPTLDGFHTVVVVKFPLIDEHGAVTAVCGVATDATQRVQAETRMHMLSAAVDQASDMVAMFELSPLGEWRIFYANDMFLRTTGYERSDVIGHTSRFLEGPRTNVEESNRRRALLKQGIPCRAEVAYYRRDGTVFWVELNARPLRGAGGSVTHTIVLYRDITQRHVEEELHALEISRDELSGLYNRRYFTRALEYAVHDARINEQVHGVLFIKIEGFVDLAQLAEILGHRLRNADVLARVGGDELAVLVRFCSLPQSQRIAKEFLDAIIRLHVEANIGVAEITSNTESADQAIHQAQDACSQAKLGGPNRVCLAG